MKPETFRRLEELKAARSGAMVGENWFSAAIDALLQAALEDGPGRGWHVPMEQTEGPLVDQHSPDYTAGAAAGAVTERQKIVAYLHARLQTPFSLGGIADDIATGKHLPPKKPF